MFNSKLTKKFLSITSAVAIMGAMAIPSLAAQQNPVTGSTQVMYTSGNIVPGPSGTSWGVEIPSGVSFTDASKEKQGDAYDVRLVSLDPNKKPLDQLYNNLKISAKVSSQNGFRFTKEGAVDGQSVGRYAYKANGALVEQSEGEKDLGEMDTTTPEKQVIKGVFTLEETVAEKGRYSDVLTYTFTQTAGELKK